MVITINQIAGGSDVGLQTFEQRFGHNLNSTINIFLGNLEHNTFSHGIIAIS